MAAHSKTRRERIYGVSPSASARLSGSSMVTSTIIIRPATPTNHVKTILNSPLLGQTQPAAVANRCGGELFRLRRHNSRKHKSFLFTANGTQRRICRHADFASVVPLQ